MARNSDQFEPTTPSQILSAPFRFVVAFGQFLVFSWSSSRNGLAFLRALPALAAVVCFAVPTIVGMYLVEKRQADFYLNRVFFYNDTMKDHPSAEVCARKLVEIDPEQFSSHFLLGLTLAAQERDTEAREVMEYAASYTPQSSFRAHLWLCDLLLKQIRQGAPDVAEKREEIKRRLQYVAEFADQETRQESAVATVTLARMFLDEEDFSTAETLLEKVLAGEMKGLQQVEAAALLGLVIEKTGDEERLQQYVSRTTDELMRLATKFPEYFQIWSAAVQLSLLTDSNSDDNAGYRRALGIIEQGIALAPTTELKRRVSSLGAFVRLREARLIQEKNLLGDPEKSFSASMGVLALAIRVNPAEAQTYEAILKQMRDLEESGQLDEWLRSALVNAPELMRLKDPSRQAEFLFVINLVIGLREAMLGNREPAVLRWKQANQQSPLTPIILDNFCNVSLRVWPERITSLTTVIDWAAETFAEFTPFARTQAMVAQQLKDFPRAQSLWETYLKNSPNDLESHRQLLKVYEARGLTDLITSQTAKIEALDLKIREANQARGDLRQ